MVGYKIKCIGEGRIQPSPGLIGLIEIVSSYPDYFLNNIIISIQIFPFFQLKCYFEPVLWSSYSNNALFSILLWNWFIYPSTYCGCCRVNVIQIGLLAVYWTSGRTIPCIVFVHADNFGVPGHLGPKILVSGSVDLSVCL